MGQRESQSRSGGSSLLAATMILLVGTTVLASSDIGRQVPQHSMTETTISQATTQQDFQVSVSPTRFLVPKGSFAYTSVFVTPINGFTGSVTLSSNVPPIKLGLPPVITLNPATLILNATLAPYFTSAMLVNTTSVTALGLYNITIVVAGGSEVHSLNALVGVSDHSVPSNGAELVYIGQFTPAAKEGGETVLQSTFEDLGYVGVGVTNLSVNLDFGSYQHNDTTATCVSVSTATIPYCPFISLDTFRERTFALTIQIPNNTYTGNHAVTITVSWVFQSGSGEIVQVNPDLIVQSTLVVYPEPVKPVPNDFVSGPSLVKPLLQILGGIAIVTVFVLGFVAWTKRKTEKKNEIMVQYLAKVRQPLNQKRCPSCGAMEQLDARFCDNCGQAIG